MNLWEKIKAQQQDGKGKIADKASDLLETCSEFVLNNMQKYTQDAVDVVKLSKLQTEVDTLRQTIRNQFTALGGQVYVLYTTEKKSAIVENIRNHIDELEVLRDELEEKERVVDELTQGYEEQSISLKKLSLLKAELESVGGSVEHLSVEEASPCIGRKLCELRLPADVILGMIIRENKAFIPVRETFFRGGDRLMIMGKKEAVIEVMHKFNPKTGRYQKVDARKKVPVSELLA